MWLVTFLSLLAWIVIGAWTVLWTIPIGLVYLVHPWLDPDLRINHRAAGIWGRGLLAMAPGCRVQVIGRGHLPLDRPVILVANHQSYADIPVLYFIRYPFKWMADMALFRIPFLGWSMRMAGYIPVRRDRPRRNRGTVEQAKAWLSKGISIFLFPEGTRSSTGAFGPFQPGGLRLAITTGTPVIPVVVVGTRRLLARDGWILRRGVRLQIRILPPVNPPPPGVRAARQLADQVRTRMEEAYRQLVREEG
jgi:1-acyl-sn-glycerol-3-phosphate acyltransferase